jgi:acetylornithine deacetylase/succinyl-diaminopimelate desuccinylase-like protein
MEEVMMTFDEYVEQNRERFIAELQDFVRQPSVAAQNLGMREMADKVWARLKKLGAAARLIPVEGGNPVVYGEIGGGPRTLLIYDHYDVQPAEPLELWETPPWAGAIRDGKIFARGVADNKSELIGRIQAIEGWLATEGELPLKIKFVVEGEEEIGSPSLGRFAQENRALIQGADGCLWEFGSKDIHERPTLTCGLKGIFYVELHAHGASRDLHSANAAIVPDPAWRLVWALNSLKDENDRILIDGYYDHVRAPNALELEALAHIPFDEAAEKANFGISRFINDLHGLELLKKLYYEPTCTICGLYSGYTGEGSKTVLPNHAFAKLDFRLVPNLTPSLVANLLRKHLDRYGFGDIEIRQTDHGEEVARSALDSRIVQAAIAATRSTYRQDPVIYPTSAGSGPMYPLCQAFGIPAVSAGCSYWDSRGHAPNENIRLADYFEGIHFIRDLIQNFAVM